MEEEFEGVAHEVVEVLERKRSRWGDKEKGRIRVWLGLEGERESEGR